MEIFEHFIEYGVLVPTTFQLMYGCGTNKSGHYIYGDFQYGYNGSDYLTFDGTDSWTAADTAGQISKRKVEGSNVTAEVKSYLEGVCVEWLRRYLDLGNATFGPKGDVCACGLYDVCGPASPSWRWFLESIHRRFSLHLCPSARVALEGFYLQ